VLDDREVEAGVLGGGEVCGLGHVRTSASSATLRGKELRQLGQSSPAAAELAAATPFDIPDLRHRCARAVNGTVAARGC
jgi:hypothetical protein